MSGFVLPRAAKRALVSVVGLSVAFTAVMGFAHTKPGRPLLALMARGGQGAAKGGCPFGYDVAQTPAQKEAGRRQFAAAHAGPERASTRPALGFKLDATTRAEVRAWAAAHGVSCKVPKAGYDLDCADVPADALPEPQGGVKVEALWMSFGAHDELTSVIAVRRDPSAEAISAAFQSVTTAVSRGAGPAQRAEGDPAADKLAGAVLRQASAEYRFRDYYALARATNMGDAFALTEEYRSLPE